MGIPLRFFGFNTLCFDFPRGESRVWFGHIFRTFLVGSICSASHAGSMLTDDLVSVWKVTSLPPTNMRHFKSSLSLQSQQYSATFSIWWRGISHLMHRLARSWLFSESVAILALAPAEVHFRLKWFFPLHFRHIFLSAGKSCVRSFTELFDRLSQSPFQSLRKPTLCLHWGDISLFWDVAFSAAPRQISTHLSRPAEISDGLQ